MTKCSIQLGPRFWHTEHRVLRRRVRSGEGDLNEDYFMISIQASQRLRFSKLSMTSGDHHSPQRYHCLMNSQNHVIIFFRLYHPTCQMQLNYDLPSSWATEGIAMVLHSRRRDAQRTLLEGTGPAATQSWSPNPPQSPANQTASPAMWSNSTHSLACLSLQEVQVSALTSSLKNSLKSLKNMVFGLNSGKATGLPSPFKMHVWVP